MNKIFRYILLVICSFIFITSVDAKEKITMYFFHGDGCPHCAAEEKFIKENKEIFSDINIVKYEVWHNDENVELLRRVINKFAMESNSIPYNVIGNTSLWLVILISFVLTVLVLFFRLVLCLLFALLSFPFSALVIRKKRLPDYVGQICPTFPDLVPPAGEPGAPATQGCDPSPHPKNKKAHQITI